MLGVEEQQLFRYLSIFVGGCTLAAAESIYGTFHRDALYVLNGVTSLIDKSLLQQTEQEREEPRLLMLETIREYGLGILQTLGEMESARQTHTHYYLRLAEDAETEIGGPQQAAWLDRLELEHDNLRAAMQWLLERPGNEGVVQDERRTEKALRLGGALRDFWRVHGHISEGRNFLKHALTTSEGIEASVRAKALIAAGNLAFIQSDYERTETLCQESLALYRELEDQPGIAHSVYLLGIVAWTRGDTPTARSLMAEALALARKTDNEERVAWSLFVQGLLESSQGEYARARALFEESLGGTQKAAEQEGYRSRTLPIGSGAHCISA